MDKKLIAGKKFYRRITAVMLALLLAIAAFPAFHMPEAAAENVNQVQLQIGRKNVTKKTYQMRPGTEKKLKVTGKPIKSMQFRSSKKSVATVSKTGVIHAKQAGTAKITAVVKPRTSRTGQGKKTAWMKVKVVKPQEQDTPDMPDLTAEPANTTLPAVTPNPSATQIPDAGSMPSLNNSKILVAYFTWSGNTETLADRIQEKTGGTKFKIETVKAYPQDYSGVYDEAMKEKQENARPELKTTVDGMAGYDTVFIGYPVWHGDAPMAVRTFLESYDFTGKKVIPFCSSGSSSPETSFASVRASAAGAEVLDGFWTRGADVANASGNINQWIDRLGILQKNGEEEIMADRIYITAGDTVFTATLASNSSAGALKDLLLQGPLTIHMNDYASMEKVGPVGTDLPRNDEHIVTEAGDIILYQGNSLVIYYDTNTWNFTRIGKIEGVSKDQLLSAMGNGDVTVTITLAP